MKQITIYDLLPLLCKGWVAMERTGDWYYFSRKPKLSKPHNVWWSPKSIDDIKILDMFNIAPFNGDWKDSLMECGK